MTYKLPYEHARRNRRTNTFDAWSYPHEAFLAGPVQADATHATSRIRRDFADIHAHLAEDIVIANTEAKATLRSVAGEAARRFPNVSYFPSYEIVMNSDPLSAWQADGVHVQPQMSDHVVSSFMRLLETPASPSVDRVLSR